MCLLAKALRLGSMGEWRITERRHEIVDVGDGHLCHCHGDRTRALGWMAREPIPPLPQCLSFMLI